jgi:hypothetical protein
MSIKWALGAIVAILSVLYVLPGIAFAHDASLSGTAPECTDGSFDVTWTLVLGTAGADNYPAYTTPSDSTEEGVGADPGLPLDSGGERIFTDPLNNGDNTYTDTSTFDSPPAGNQVTASGTVYWQDLQALEVSATVNTPTQACSCAEGQVGEPPECQDPTCENGGIDPGSDQCHTFTQICVNGDVVTVRDDSQQTDTGNCGSVRLCLDNGQSATVTEAEAEGLLDDGATRGSCTPTENPPPPTPTPPTVTPPPPVQEVQETVAEVSPAVDEVVALPSAGYGSTSNGSFSSTWAAILAMGLFGVGGATAVLARHRKS